MRLIADGRLVWIMRELSGGPLRAVDLRDRIGIPHTTLLEKLDLLGRAGVTWREERGGRAAGVLHHLLEAGHGLLRLVDRVLASNLPADPAATGLIFAPSGHPALKVLADEATPDLLLALAGPPKRPASLERSLSLTRSQLNTRLKSLEQARFVLRDGDRYALSNAGREATAFLLAAGQLEETHCLPEATPARPHHFAALLSVAVPLIPPPTSDNDVYALTIEGHPRLGQRETATCTISSRHGESLTAEPALADGRSLSADARAPIQDWCAALIQGELANLRFGGETELALELVTGLHERVFDCGAIEKLRVSESISSLDRSD